MEVVDQSKIPRIARIDLIICRHLHPLLKIGENGHSLRGGTAAAAVDVALPSAQRGSGCRGTLAAGAIVSPARRQRGLDSSLDLVHLAVVFRLTDLKPLRPLLRVIVERDPGKGRRQPQLLSASRLPYLMGEFFCGVDTPPFERRGLVTRGMPAAVRNCRFSI